MTTTPDTAPDAKNNTTDGIRSVRHGSTLQLTLARPESGNALGMPQMRALVRAVEGGDRDPQCRVITLSADGDEFCRGLDIEAALPAGGDPGERAVEVAALVREFGEHFVRLASARVPIIACVGGAASGGGVGIAAACDLVIATPQATFMLPEVIVGMIPALITPILARRLTPARVRYMALSSRCLDGAEAHVVGLVDELTDDLDAACVRQIKRILYSSPDALCAYERYLDSAGDIGTGTPAETLHAHMDRAIGALENWLAQPGVIDAARDFAAGGRPPWFERYRAPAETDPRRPSDG